MATARERRAAQRQTARYVREAKAARDRHRPPIPSRLPAGLRATSKAAMERYAYDVMSGAEPMPAAGTPEANQLARMAAWGSRGKADPHFEAAFSQYWYHNKDQQPPDEDDEEYPEDYEDEEE